MTFDFCKYLMGKTSRHDFTDNDACRMAAYFVQNGQCYVTGTNLKSGQRQLHHRKPRYYGGKDVPDNLILLDSTVHKMVHTRSAYLFEQLAGSVGLTDAQMHLLNQLRVEAHRRPMRNA